MEWLTITVDGETGEFQVRTYLQNVSLGSVCSKDQAVILQEVKQRMQLILGLAKGKTLTSKSSRV